MSENNTETPMQQSENNADATNLSVATPVVAEKPKKKTGLIVGIVAALVVVLVVVGVVFYNVFNSKPEKAEVEKGMVTIWNDEASDSVVSQLTMYGMSKDEATEKVQQAAQPYAKCFVDKVYDQAKPRTLKWLAAGEDKQDPADLSLVQSASATCAQQAIAGVLQ